jgi:hypothetical protein
MDHPDVEIPQAQPAVFANASETVVPVVASPRIKRHRGYPGLVSLTSGDDGRLGNGPDRDEIVLASGQDIFAVRRPAYARQTAVVRVEEIKQPV